MQSKTRKSEADRRKALIDKLDKARTSLQKLDSAAATKARKKHQHRSFVIGEAVQHHLEAGGPRKIDLGPVLEIYLDALAQKSLAKATADRAAVIDLMAPPNYDTLRQAGK